MKRSPVLIPTAEVTVGAVVAKTLTDSNGQILVPAGAALTDKALDLLARREVSELLVYQPLNLSEEERQQLISDTTAQLDRQFALAENTQTMQQFKAMLLRYHTRNFQ